MKQINADFYIDGMLAGLYSKMGDYQKALASINLLIESDTTDFKAYSMRMDIYYDMDSIDLSLADAYKITKLAPDDADALSESAQLYFFAGHYRRAILECNKILALQPTYNYFRYLRGRSYLALGEQPSLANEDLSKVRTIRDLMYYAAYTGDIDGLGKKFSITPETLKSIIWYYTRCCISTPKDNLYAQETIDKWKEKFEQEFSIRNSPISSVSKNSTRHARLS